MENNTPKTKSKMKYFIAFLTVVALITSAFAVYNILLLDDIENAIRYYVIGIFCFINLVLILRTRKRFKARKKKWKNAIFIIMTMIYIAITIAVGFFISVFYGLLSDINREYTLFSSSLVVINDSPIRTPGDLNNKRIAILDNSDSVEGYIIPRLILEEYNLEPSNEIIEYPDFTAMVADLYTDEIDAIFIPSHFGNMFTGIEMFESIEYDTRVIVYQEKSLRREDTSRIATASRNRNLDEPFTMLLMGIDETGEILGTNAANGDTLIILTFNPKTLNSTMFSVPRDTFMPIACWANQRENKITHAAAHGKDCVIDSLENFFDITIDYYAMINFVGMVRLVDAVGGVEVDVPRHLCTDDSNREHTVCIEPGLQTLSGEEALVFARNRFDMPNGDLDRMIHQQEILMALVQELRHLTSFSAIMEILDTISVSLDTNLTTQQMLSFYNLARDIMATNVISEDLNIINIQQLFLEGHGQRIFDEVMRLTLWNYIPNEESRRLVAQAMRVNLGLEEAEIIKNFSFSINEPFEREVIGRGSFAHIPRTNTISVPSFIGLTESAAISLANRHGISFSFVGTGNVVITQSISMGNRIDPATSGIILTLGGGPGNNQNNDNQTLPPVDTTPDEPTTLDPDIPDPDDPLDIVPPPPTP